MNDLNKTLRDIARGPEFLPVEEPAPVARMDREGPSAWDYVKDQPSAFGPEEDFRVYRYEPNDCHVFYAVSVAALNWAYAKLPADIDRHNVRGFQIESQWIDFIVSRAKADKLMSREDYEEAMEENHNLMLSRES